MKLHLPFLEYVMEGIVTQMFFYLGPCSCDYIDPTLYVYSIIYEIRVFHNQNVR